MNESIGGLFNELKKVQKRLQGYISTSYLINKEFISPQQTQGSEYDALTLSNHTVVINVPTVWKPNANVYKVGSLAMAIPDGTIKGGNLRGYGAVDLQMTRNAPDRVAYGEYAFSAGKDNTSSGKYSCAIGWNNTVQGDGSVALGASNGTSGNYIGVAIGTSNSFGQNYATAIGHSNTANGYDSLALGYSNHTSNNGAMAIGYDNTTAGDKALSIGSYGTASASNAIAIGASCTSSGDTSIAMGSSASASGTKSIAMGTSTIASATYAFAFGYSTQATVASSFAMGSLSTSTGLASHTFGFYNNANYRKYTTVLGTWGRGNIDNSVSIGFKGDSTSYTTPILQGKYQRTVFNLMAYSTDDTAKVLTSDGSSTATVSETSGGTINSYLIPVSSTALVRYNLLGVTGNGASATRFNGEVHIRKGTTIDSIVIINQSQTQAGDAGLDGANLNISANTTLGTLDFSVAGIASTNIRWSLIADSDEVKHG